MKIASCLACLFVAVGCADEGDDASHGDGGKGGDDGVVVSGVEAVEHIAVDAGKVYFQTGAIGYFVVDGTEVSEIGRSALGPAGFAVRGGVVYFANNLTIDRYEAGESQRTWRDIVAIAAEVDDAHLYIANCDGVGRLAFDGSEPEGMVQGCFDTLGLTAGRAWAQNDSDAVAAPKILPGTPLDVKTITKEPRPVLVGTDATGAFFPTAGGFPLLRVDDDGSMTTIAGDGGSLVDSNVRASRYRVARRGDEIYALSRPAADVAEGSVLRLHLDGSAPEILATFSATIATLAVDDTHLYYTDGDRIVRLSLP